MMLYNDLQIPTQFMFINKQRKHSVYLHELLYIRFSLDTSDDKPHKTEIFQ